VFRDASRGRGDPIARRNYQHQAGLADVPCVEDGAYSGSEHQVVFVPLLPRSRAEVILTVMMIAERVGTALR